MHSRLHDIPERFMHYVLYCIISLVISIIAYNAFTFAVVRVLVSFTAIVSFIALLLLVVLYVKEAFDSNK